MSDFPATRLEALSRLAHFVPKAGRDYAARRNLDLGRAGHAHVSQLSPYLRHRVITETEVLEAVLARHSAAASEKFVQEVFWRTYWKGWLELRPTVWDDYQDGLRAALNAVQTQSGLRRSWEDACKGQTGIACFDAWAQELAQTGYLHNHARMWFASIWVFTLRLPWELGADFFLRHLLDGDPASNTLGWRWVAGIQTPGKTYLARRDNIAKYTEGRFHPAPGELADSAQPLDSLPHPARRALPQCPGFDPAIPTAFVLHEDDLSPHWLLQKGLRPLGTATLTPSARLSPLVMAPATVQFRAEATADAATRWAEHLGDVTTGLQTGAEISEWAQALGARQIVTSYAPTGAASEVLKEVSGLPVLQQMRPYDAEAWPYATAGFFKFKAKIPALLGQIKGLRAA